MAFEWERQFTSDASNTNFGTDGGHFCRSVTDTLELGIGTTEEYMDALLVIRRQGAENHEADQSYAGFCPAGDGAPGSIRHVFA